MMAECECCGEEVAFRREIENWWQADLCHSCMIDVLVWLNKFTKGGG